MKTRLFIPVILLLLLMTVSILTAGCAAPGLTKQEVHRRHKNVFNNDLLQMQEDIDAVLMIDRPSRLSDMMVR